MCKPIYQIRQYQTIQNQYFTFWELSVNGHYYFEEFCSAVQTNIIDVRNLKRIHSLMDNISPFVLLPKAKFNHIRGVKDINGKENVYEFKCKNLRVYVYMKKPDVFIVIGGFKSNQNKDIERLKGLIRNFNTEDYEQE